MFEIVKNEILAVGFDEIVMIPRATDPRTELAVSLLNDAGMKYLELYIMYIFLLTTRLGMNAYWSPSPYAFADVIGLTVCYLIFL